MGIIRGIFRLILNFLIGLVKQWAGFLFQGAGVVAATVFAPYLQYTADVRQDISYFIWFYAVSVGIVGIAYRNKRWSLVYAQQFFRFIQWFLAVLASIAAPFIPGFFPFLTIPGVVPKLAISALVFILLLFVGIFVALGEIFRIIEHDMVETFEKRLRTPNYEAILMGEEFEHHPMPPLTRRDRLTNWWEREMRLLRRSIQKLRDS